ncbi:MAG TPA: Wzz/FepE/Etk N-terminal domain-containing protein [Ignavibacteria bacterium]|nr:Wzz/FepE/Etk N-terminal domain-containing protein [Ignavibacteria bacterium]HMR40236.1 Wzz/FepE/Etk N-terminal domain-containing protein [Ignavibacteria bacterium]
MQEANSENKQGNEISILELIKIYSKNKKSIIISSLIAGLITAIIVFFVMDPIFLSTGTLKATSKSGGLGSLIGGGIPDIGDLSNITGELGSGTKELALYENILTSRRCIDDVLLKFDLNKEWEFKYYSEAVKHFRKNVLEITKDKMAGTLEIGVYDKDPVRAKDIVEFLINDLNKINTELNIQNAKNNREFIEQRYELVKKDLKQAEDSLKEYQDINGIAPDIVVKAVAESQIKLEFEIKSEEVKLDLLKKILSPDQAEIKNQEQKIISLNQQLNQIIEEQAGNNSLSLKGAPDLVLNYMRLMRNVEIQNKILAFIIPLFEQAKIEEKKETPSLLVLDNPFIPDRKVKPKRLTVTVIVVFFTFILSLMFFVLKSKWYSYKNNY